MGLRRPYAPSGLGEYRQSGAGGLPQPEGGRITTLNSFCLPILIFLRLSGEKDDATVVPSYYMNSHAVIYVLRGNARIQIADDNGQSVFDVKLQDNQVLVVPQNFVVIKKAGSEGFEWVAFRTSDNMMKNNLVGRLSVIRGLPEDVLVNSYGISRDDARKLKYNREELIVFSPTSRSTRALRRDDAANYDNFRHPILIIYYLSL
ncbi:hypothetical protein SAY87_015055 [Trapa incisa]|uniref:Cupin type-1 domain-containing protein n=1 Tax=Trapa incisa TaxID=236973 RepID=A0AAN7H0K2_9MYRT|nr:hypothetical protein SAY87_015055 [Trapa incisa]